MLPFHTILHPTDFSESADYAYRVACMLARESHAKLVVLYVAGLNLNMPKPISTELGIAFDCSGNDHTRHAELKSQLHEQFEKSSNVPVETRLIYGAAVEEILRTAKELKCDLLVMGTHGRTGLGHLLLGSVAEAVLNQAECPVLTVKSPAKAHAAS
jgi:universal stress protein A